MQGGFSPSFFRFVRNILIYITGLNLFQTETNLNGIKKAINLILAELLLNCGTHLQQSHPVITGNYFPLLIIEKGH